MREVPERDPSRLSNRVTADLDAERAAGEAFGLYVSTVKADLTYARGDSFWSNVRRIHSRIRSRLSNGSVFLQLLVETGVPGLLIGLWGALAVLHAARRDPWRFAALAGVLMHAFVDLDLQIPAISALLVVLAAVPRR